MTWLKHYTGFKSLLSARQFGMEYQTDGMNEAGSDPNSDR